MSQTKISSKIYPLIRAVATAAVLPVLFIYIMVAKPDYAIMNALGHVVVPVAQVVGDVITWPFRVIGNTFSAITQVSSLREENKELRARLDAAMINKDLCDIAIKENQKLTRQKTFRYHFLKNCFESDIMKGLDRGLGFLFGVVEGLVYVGLILVVLYAQPWFNVNGLLDKSFFHNLLGALLSAPADSLRSMVINV